ncbi:hypothetical protein FMM05_14230 [Flavobacterium zepuense]|uniref:Uncharacterized protein n=1 Tax=Flavobacterium zepuense TaxID=2593302 RepID=A0A552UYP6_9FLAO|nr:hypothetical protein [Flavobacterium zepuense]TRW23347.1 hypothetical protein FMM05_14230 [Flavobacterium zepuense]
MQQVLIIAFLFCAGACRGQVPGVVADGKEIIKLELLRYKDDFSNKYDSKTVVGDSILLTRQIAVMEQTPDELRLYCPAFHFMSVKEAAEILEAGLSNCITNPLQVVIGLRMPFLI